MEQRIELNDLIQYLTNVNYTIETFIENKEELDKFNLEPLEVINSSKFKFFKKIFKHYVDRIGIIQKMNNIDISCLASILYCIDEDYYILQQNEQEYLIKSIKKKIKNDTLNRKFKIGNKVTKQMIITNMNNKTMDKLSILIFAYYFKINIFQFDFNKGDIIIYYPDDEFNMYRKNVFLSLYDGYYNPLTYKNDNGRIFKYNSSILENIIFSEDVKLFSLKKKKFEICNNWDTLLSEYKNINLNTIILDVPDDLFEINSDEEDSDTDFKLNFENITEEINIMNLEVQDEPLYDEDSDELILETINDEILDKLKSMSKSALRKEKKENLINYLVDIFNIEEKSIKKNKKNELILMIEQHINI